MAQTTSTTIGQHGENAAAEFLARQGFKVLQRNWKIPAAEIDLVCCKQECIYFVEVKYRSTAQQGSGLEYVHPRKLQQMIRAAELWVLKNEWNGDYQLAAISVTADFAVEEFVEIVT